MMIGVSWCDTWWCLAYLWIGGVLEATAPYGILSIVLLVMWLMRPART